jgi:ATP-binding cassette, subfamily B, bacterial MsbA
MHSSTASRQGLVDYSSRSIIKRIFKDYVLQYKKQIMLAVILMIIVAAGDAFFVLLVRPALDGIFISKNLNLFWLIPLLVVGTACIKGFADYGQNYIIKSVGQSVVNYIQLKLYSHLVHSDLQGLNQTSSGHLLSKFTNDIFNIRQAITSSIVNIAKELLTVIFFICVMFYNDYKLALATFCIFPFMVFPVIRGGRKMKKITFKTQDKLADYTKLLNEKLHNIKIIKAFCSERREVREGKRHLDDILDFYKSSIKIEAIVSPIMEVLASIAIATVLVYGGYSVVNGTTTPGSLFSFITALLLAYKPLKALASMNIVLQAGLASAKRILVVLDEKNSVEDSSNKKVLKVKKGKIKFEKVSFLYEKKHLPVIQDLSFEIKPGQVTAIVGESGSGKSTLVDLLLKFYKPTQGKVFIDEEDLADVSTSSIRKNIAFVNQEIMLFDASVKENIAYGTEKYNEKEIVSAAKIADAEEFISNLKQKYNTVVGKFGIKLSGGQRQRIAIARAVLKNAPILILDEATSSLDQVTELNVKNAILGLKNKYKAIIIITHRLNAIKSSDVIYVMKKGKLIEFGKHKELLDKKGEYYRLYNKGILN